MSARSETIKFPGGGSGHGSHRGQWYAALAVVAVAAAVTVAMVVMNSSNTATNAPQRVPAVTHQQGTDTGGAVVAPNTTIQQVGGTSVYRFHPLPGANSAFELIAPRAAGGANQGPADPTVGGGSAYQYHPLP